MADTLSLPSRGSLAPLGPREALCAAATVVDRMVRWTQSSLCAHPLPRIQDSASTLMDKKAVVHVYKMEYYLDIKKEI